MRPSRNHQPPLGDAELGELQVLLDAVPAPLEPLDVSALDGFLAAIVLLHPPVAAEQWLRFVADVDGRQVPPGFQTGVLHALATRRLDELEQAVARRRWFDPWVFELETPAAPSQALVGWVGGFDAALAHFPNAALERTEAVPALALLYRHLDLADIGDAGDELLAEIESLEPAATLADGVEDLVCATLLLADLSRPLPTKPPRRGAR